MAKKSKTAKKEKRPKRQERRFIAQASTNPTLVRVLGAISAFVLGAGVWAYFYASSFGRAAKDAVDIVGSAPAASQPLDQLPAYLIAGGAILLGIVFWIGTSSEAPVRVGAPGISVEKGELRRMPWWAVEKILYEGGAQALVVSGKDEAGVGWTFKLATRSHTEAIGWILKEALDRIPRRVDIPDETLAKLPGAPEHAGTLVDLEPLQVVGKKCAVSGKTISYEPDARVCDQCERVYLKRKVPKKCKCGASLLHLRPKDADDEDEIEDDEDENTKANEDAEEAAEQ